MNYLDFTMSELIHSDTAIKLNINNMPTIQALDNMLDLMVHCLQPIRDLIGLPIIVTSGYRCPRLNEAVKGSKTSHHVIGTCADIKIKGMTPKETYDFIKRGYFKYRQLILEPTWVHIEYKKDDLKQQNLIFKNGKYILDEK